MKILFVCLGNICRSPIAQGIFEDLLSQSSINKNKIDFIDSAGTADYHIGKQADQRMRQTAKDFGFNIDHLRGRQVAKSDFEEFDRIYAMDRRNLENLIKICPNQHKHKISLFLSNYNMDIDEEVPDPFHGDENDFREVLQLIQNGAQSILNSI